jgi:hypothetical protein
MADATASAETFDEDAFEREWQLVSEAVQAVAEANFLRVTVAGLEFGEDLLFQAQAMAETYGLRVRALSTADGRGASIVVEVDDTARVEREATSGS